MKILLFMSTLNLLGNVTSPFTWWDAKEPCPLKPSGCLNEHFINFTISSNDVIIYIHYQNGNLPFYLMYKFGYDALPSKPLALKYSLILKYHAQGTYFKPQTVLSTCKPKSLFLCLQILLIESYLFPPQDGH